MAHRRPIARPGGPYNNHISIDFNEGKKETVGRLQWYSSVSASSKCRRVLGLLRSTIAKCFNHFLRCRILKNLKRFDSDQKIKSWAQLVQMSQVLIQQTGPLSAFVIYSMIVMFFLLVTYRALSLLRTDASNDAIFIPVIIKYLDYTSFAHEDIGGFLYPNRKHLIDTILQKTMVLQSNQTAIPYYGGILFPLQRNRSIKEPIPDITMNQSNKTTQRRRSEIYVSFRRWTDDDYELATRAGSTVKPKCRHPVWHKFNYQNCNLFHEMDASRRLGSQVAFGRYHTDDDTIPLSHGYYRDTWVVGQAKSDHLQSDSNGDSVGAPFVLKTIRISSHNITYKTLDTVRKDALVMERLTSSPRIIDIYGYCGSSMAVEYVENEMESVIVPGTGYMTEDLQKMHDWFDIHPRNTYSVEEKLQIALSMAESLADLHGFKDGVIVHDDVQLCQWLRKKKTGKLKLGDFNRAGLMLFDETANVYCKYNNGGCYGNYRAPEEFAAGPLDEAIDVYSFGNNIYALLTGLWVFYTLEDDAVVQGKVIKGERAFIDLRYRNHSFIESKLVELMEMCWAQEPAKRINIFQVVQYLRKVVEESRVSQKMQL